MVTAVESSSPFPHPAGSELPPANPNPIFNPIGVYKQGMAAVTASQNPPTTASSSSSSASSPSLEAAGVSFLLKYWQGLAFSRDATGGGGGVGGEGGGRGGGGGRGRDEAMERICQAVLGLKGHARWWLLRRSGSFVVYYVGTYW